MSMSSMVRGLSNLRSLALGRFFFGVSSSCVSPLPLRLPPAPGLAQFLLNPVLAARLWALQQF